MCKLDANTCYSWLCYLASSILPGSCRSWNWWFGRLTPRPSSLSAYCKDTRTRTGLFWGSALDDPSDTHRSVITSSFPIRNFLPFFL